MTFQNYEFFAGGGMVRQGLGPNWSCLFANDFDAKKVSAYQKNWGSGEIKLDDIHNLTTADLPGHADLAWASFPCQDLSLAGKRVGLKGGRSGAFWGFYSLMEGLSKEGRSPPLIALENVIGLLTSHNGADFVALCDALVRLGYHVGAMAIDGSLFTPQSRPRLFVVAAKEPRLIQSSPAAWCSTNGIVKAVQQFPAHIAEKWVWWALSPPSDKVPAFADLIEDHPASVEWHSPEETQSLLAMMNSRHMSKVTEAQTAGRRMVGAIYKRTRVEKGVKVQRAEIRFDLAGCLRTPAGGSSRQLIMVVDGPIVRSRLISSRETARLMGLPDSYILPENYTDAYHLTGDGVVSPVIRHLAQHIFEKNA